MLEVFLALASFVAAEPSAAEPAAMGQPIIEGGFRITLLASMDLTAPERQTKHGQAAGGKRVIWLVEPPPAKRPRGPKDVVMPVLSEARLSFAGRQYNPVISALSSKPFSPDIIVHDYARFAAEHPDWLGPQALNPRADSGVLEVIIRGGPIKAGDPGIAEIRLGVTPTGVAMSESKDTRFVWCRSSMGPAK